MITVSDSEVREVLRRIGGVQNAMKKHQRRALTDAAQPLIDEIQAKAPESEKAHQRYATAKLVKGIRAPKGMGSVVATYQPGNLRESFGVLRLRQTPAVIVGPKLGKGSGSNYGPGGATDAYYAHIVEYGTVNIPAQPFVRPAIMATEGLVLKRAVENLKSAIERYEKGLPPMRISKTKEDNSRPDIRTFDEL